MDTVAVVAQVGLGLLAAAGVELGRRRHGPRVQGPWRLFSLGLGLWVLDDLAAQVPGTGPVPVADLLHLAGYLVLSVGLYGLVRAGESRRDLAGVIDAATAATALGVLALQLVVDTRPSPDLAFLAGDIFLVGGVVRIAVGTHRWSPATRLLLLALGLQLLTDAARVAGPGGDAGAVVVLVQHATLLLWGAAALHPSMVQLTELRRPRAFAVRLRLSLAGVCACLPVLGLVLQPLVGQEPTPLLALVGTTVVVGLLMGRQQLAFDRLQEVTDQTRELRDQLAYEATHDALTALPNRAHGLVLLQAALGRLRGGRPDRTVTVMFVDLDGFKRVNDVFGHTAGDQLLRRVADRMSHSTRGEDVAIRLGGDEFVVVLETLDGLAQAHLVAERLIEAVSRPVRLGPLGSAHVGASIGIAQTSDPEADAAALLAEADVAAYEAKSRGKGRAVVYDDDMKQGLLARDLLVEQLRTGLERDELVLHYQPVVDSFSGEVRGYEALVRWQHPTLGLLPPARFLPAAETAGLIGDVDRWALREACQQLQRWVDLHDFDRLVVAVNISPTTAARVQLVTDVEEALLASGLRGDRLALELPETVLQDPASVSHLRAVRDLGVSVSICEFGSGVSQLAHLADLPVNVVKIGRDALELAAPLGDRLLQLMIQGAHAVGLNAVAEGVERDHQLATLRALDCELVQGFQVARPMPATDVPAFHGTRRIDPFSHLLG